ncbi:MAG: PKD domain-containing protein [Pseudomonadota bacterium]
MRTSSFGQVVSVAAGALLLAGASMAGTEGSAVAPGLEDGKAGHAGKDVYGIVNLASGTGFFAGVNARGQAAFDQLSLNGEVQVGFFDGERVRDISPPNHVVALFRGLNERGEVALEARVLVPGSEPSEFGAYRWSPARGLVRLPPVNNDIDSGPSAINNRGEIAGAIRTGADNYQATRWTPANRLMPLAGLPGLSYTYTNDINDSNVTVGYGALASNSAVSRAIVWNSAGRPSLLSVGGNSALAYHINNRGEIAGMLDINGPVASAYLWSPGKPVVRAGPRTVVTALNEAGQLVGRIQPTGGDTHAFFFSRASGLIDLHPRSFYSSEAQHVNDSGIVVGTAQRSGEESLAFRWSRKDGAVDLNTRLLDPPAGLVLHNARVISPNGDILADSSAGMVLLRAGGRGTDAPVLGPLQYLPFEANEPARFTLSFRDRNVRETHTATIDWGDGAGPQPVPLRENKGRGLVDVVHTYPEWGVYRVVVRVTDSAGRSTSLESRVWLLDSFPVLRGEGRLADKAAAPSTVFRLAAPLAPNSKAGFSFQLLGKTAFRAEQLDKVRVEGNRVWLEGVGQLDGRPGYRFAIDATAGDGAAQASRMAVRITQADPKGGAQHLVFQTGEDRQAAQAEQAQAGQAGVLRQGSIRILRRAN